LDQRDDEAVMRYFAGLDLSLEDTAICVVDEVGKVIREGKVDR
jgi:transposase